MNIFKKGEQEKSPNKQNQFLFSKPLEKPYESSSSSQPFIKNGSSFSEKKESSILSVTEERVWSLKNVQIALFLGFALLLVDIFLLFLFNTNLTSSLIIILVTIIVYAIGLYFLLNPPSQKIVEKERIKQIEKPTIKVVEKPVFKEIIRVVEKPVETIKYVDKPIIKTVSSPVTIPINKDPFENYKYVASKLSKTVHSTKNTAGRMINSKNREFSNELKGFKKRGYKLGKILKEK